MIDGEFQVPSSLLPADDTGTGWEEISVTPVRGVICGICDQALFIDLCLVIYLDLYPLTASAR